jgi:hypothetical protein
MERVTKEKDNPPSFLVWSSGPLIASGKNEDEKVRAFTEEKCPRLYKGLAFICVKETAAEGLSRISGHFFSKLALKRPVGISWLLPQPSHTHHLASSPHTHTHTHTDVKPNINQPRRCLGKVSCKRVCCNPVPTITVQPPGMHEIASLDPVHLSISVKLCMASKRLKRDFTVLGPRLLSSNRSILISRTTPLSERL